MLRAESVVVKKDRLIVVVRVADGAPRFTSREIMDRILVRFPDLPFHSCVNAKGPQFGDVMDHTSIPHVLEHILIDLQAEAYTQRQGEQACVTKNPPLLTGATKWIDREAGLAQVQVSYFDDIVALSALKEGLAFLEGLASGKTATC